MEKDKEALKQMEDEIKLIKEDIVKKAARDILKYEDLTTEDIQDAEIIIRNALGKFEEILNWGHMGEVAVLEKLIEDRGKMKQLETWEAKIFIGLREGYSNKFHSIGECKALVQDFVNDIGWCVTLTPTEFIYKNGSEPGIIVGIINYPRFPLDVKELQKRIVDLATLLKKQLKQDRLSIVFPNETILMGAEEENKE